MNTRSLTALVCSGLAVLSTFCAIATYADGPADNVVEKVRRIPPAGVPVSEENKADLTARVADLRQSIQAAQGSIKTNQRSALVDVEIFHKAVDYAVRYDEFFRTNEVKAATNLLRIANERLASLKAGEVPWNSATGLVVRGYVSRIDGSVQPYGLVVPPTYHADSPTPYRVDCWFHGRGETLSELAFLAERIQSPGEFRPPNTIVLHLYGRYCNANRFAGEIDLLEALDDLRKHYPVDENRIVVRGFSMGGAACWTFATHYTGLWAAAAPGAGFSETADFLKVFQKESVKPTWYEQKLWHWYDSIDYAVNLFNLPTVAYSGEIDGQKQAADMMEKALKKEGIAMTHIIGPNTPHRYHPEAREEVNRRINSIAAISRNPAPLKVKFTTWLLRYNKMFWLTVDGMQKHWDRARVDAEIDVAANTVRVAVTNVTAFTFDFAAGEAPLDVTRPAKVKINGQTLSVPAPYSDRSWNTSFQLAKGAWRSVAKPDWGGLHKSSGITGPIDDAFMDSFVMVRPTGTAMNSTVGDWVKGEMEHATVHWRRQFRGDARVVDDSAVNDALISSNNLVLWGDPQSNQVLAKILDKLPVKWTKDTVELAGKTFTAGQNVPVLIFPNPLNPKRYIVLNSGFTYREYDYLNNARQTAKLPDYAVLDVSAPPTSRFAGKVVHAGFFDESWKPTRQD